MKYAFLVAAAAGLVLAAAPAFSQSQFPGATGNPGGEIAAQNASQNFYGMSQDNLKTGRHMTTYNRADIVERDRQEIHNLNQQIARAANDEERDALRKRKRDIQNEIIEVQQAN
jgi:hypothetical protein